ncbi:aminotransferase class V-fold PLP-dependent enzyme [Thiocapsa bogorovii]|uniref:aminotransferase class V-fold PLP-dependent enzyme n=1 Tax=Thiocapsa bogorovii TaxID=521689 RepID=UPI001E2CBF5E|nr:aminotransferase class V-fold PLP-dependent enzyme [Thiocapsa bogorovii]UHD14950.1 aminotransferase class V-fold PLP-dependent enzyme [Thiocapsa bogorovii]
MTASKQGSGLDRRDFLKGFASAGIAAGFVGPGEVLAKAQSGPPAVPPGQFGRNLLPPPTISGPQSGEGYWAKVRKTFSLPNDYIHMNTGTTGSPPQFVVNNLAVYNLYKAEDPRDWGANLAADFPTLFPTSPSATGARQAQVAEVYGANPDEIVLSYNTTDACNLIFAGTPWKPGDRIVTTSFEHPALAGPIAWARDYHGVEVVIVDIPSNFTAAITVDEVLDWFESELSVPLDPANKQYLAISEIFYKNGVRMPIPELCALARHYGAYSIIDTAHGWGMLPIDCHAYGADFIAGAGHKWLCGGPGTGILYVRNSGTDPLPPFAMGNFFLYGNPFVAQSTWYESRAWNPSVYMQFRGESNTPALYAMTDSVSYFDQIGVIAIYDRGVALGNYLKGLIAAQWGPSALWVQENSDARFATALTSFNPFADKDNAAAYGAMNAAISAVNGALAAETPKIYIRSVTWRSSSAAPADDRVGFRISTHGVYNNYDEIDDVFDRLVYHINQSDLAQL